MSRNQHPAFRYYGSPDKGYDVVGPAGAPLGFVERTYPSDRAVKQRSRLWLALRRADGTYIHGAQFPSRAAAAAYLLAEQGKLTAGTRGKD